MMMMRNTGPSAARWELPWVADGVMLRNTAIGVALV